jgi:circadian clock protein KaiB
MSERDIYEFRIYVVGDAPNSTLALANLSALCHAHLPDRHQIEVVDVLRNPRRGFADGILLTPTLVKLSPLPVRKIVGTLSRSQHVLQALGLPSQPR